jgi:hypothetical protein
MRSTNGWMLDAPASDEPWAAEGSCGGIGWRGSRVSDCLATVGIGDCQLRLGRVRAACGMASLRVGEEAGACGGAVVS